MAGGGFQADNTDQQQCHKNEAGGSERLFKQYNSHDYRAQRPDACPDGIGGSQGKLFGCLGQE